MDVSIQLHGKIFFKVLKHNRMAFRTVTKTLSTRLKVCTRAVFKGINKPATNLAALYEETTLPCTHIPSTVQL